MNWTLHKVVALATVAVLGAGCSNGSGGTDTANRVTDTSADRLDQGISFSQCMRDNGVADFPDPGAAGQLTIDAIANGTSVDTESAVFEQALTACGDLEPVGFTGSLRTSAQQAAALLYAQCVRDHGVSDFPDPGPDDPLIDTNQIPSANEPGGMDALHAAMDQCDPTDAGVTGP